MDKVVVDVKLNEKDVFEFQKAHYARSVKPGMRYAIIAILSVLFITNIALDILSGNFISITALLLGLTLFIIAGTPLMFRLTARKGLRTNKMLMAEHTYTFTADGISSVSENHTMNAKWDAMHEFRETRDHFLFYVGNNQAFLVPKRVFENDEARLGFVRQCAAVIPKPKKPFPLLKITMAVTFGFVVLMFILLLLFK
ncbi:MAG: YcxB family protein [Clostridia bacterium]